MKTFRHLAVICVGFLVLAQLVVAAPTLQKAFIFGSRNLTCPTFNQPATNYTAVYHQADSAAGATALEYTAARGWGYEVLAPGNTAANGYGRFGVNATGGALFDNTPNNRNFFPDSCPAQIYDSFIGAKNFSNTCSVTAIGDPDTPCAPTFAPEGIIFRVDVPNGKYRFVAAVGDPDNPHAHRILAEDGGSGPPRDIGDNHVVLVSNFDEARACPPAVPNDDPWAFARVGFGCYIPPPAAAVTFVNMDQDGLATEDPPDSPTLTVTQGYIRIHQLQGNSNDGTCSVRDPNGGDMVILEAWNVGNEVIPPAVYIGAITRTIDPPVHAADGVVSVNLQSAETTLTIQVAETIPAGYEFVNAGGGTISGSTNTLSLPPGGSATYTVRATAGTCKSGIIVGEILLQNACSAIQGDSVLNCAGSLSPTGAVREQLVIGPIDINTQAANTCDDTGNFATADYLTDGTKTQANIMAKLGDEIMPDFGGSADRSLGVETAGANTAINPKATDGILTAWKATANTFGAIDYNAAENIGDPGTAGDVLDYVVYSLVYLENMTLDCKDVVLRLGSDDAIKMVYNGEVVFTNAICRGLPGAAAGDLVPITLQAGKNVVLLCVLERGGGTAVRLMVQNPDGTPVTDNSVRYSLVPPAVFPVVLPHSVTRSIAPAVAEAGNPLAITLTATDVVQPITVIETYPAEYPVLDAGGGAVDTVNHTLTLNFTASGSKTYTLQVANPCPNCTVNRLSGLVTAPAGCNKRVIGTLTFECDIGAPTCPAQATPKYVLEMAFAFGVHAPLAGNWGNSSNDPAVPYTMVEQIDVASVTYDAGRGWGYEAVYEAGASPYTVRGGYEVFGPFDDSANARAHFPTDTLPDEIYDSFIGGKVFLTPCGATETAPCDPPEGIIFHVDVPNGKYRFVAAIGECENTHAHRILAENGGSGPPENIGAEHVVLASNYDQAAHLKGQINGPGGERGAGVYGRVGFDNKIPPLGDGVPPDPQFVNLDENGNETIGCANSPTLTVTQGYIRVHQLQGRSVAGCASPNDPEGGDLVVLELWRIDEGPTGVGVFTGNANGDGTVNIADAVTILGYLFGKPPKPVIPCFKSADSNDDNTINVADAIDVLTFLFGAAGPNKPMTGPDGLPVATAACRLYPAADVPAQILGQPGCATPCRP